MAAFSGCLHSLESQRCGDVTAVGGQWGAAGMLPSVSGHITWRSGTVGHVGWDLSWSGVRSHAGCWYKTAHSWEPVRCLRERKDSHITVFHVSPVRRHRRESASELTVSWFYFWAVFFFFFPLDFLLTLLWPESIQSCYLNKHRAEKQDTVLSTNAFFLRKLQPENSQFLLLWFASIWRRGRVRKRRGD